MEGSLNPQQMISIIKQHYNLDPMDVQYLSGYEDTNFLITDIHQNKYICKVASQTSMLTQIQAQNEAMMYLNQQQNCQIEFPNIILSNNNQSIIKVQKGHKNYIRILTYIQGAMMNKVLTTDNILRSYGKALAIIDKHLMKFTNATLEERHISWDIKNTLFMRKYLQYVQKEDVKQLIIECLNIFQQNALPIIQHLPKSIIHNDGHSHNIVVDVLKQQIVGMIDFGDMVYTCTVFEICIALTYIIHDSSAPMDSLKIVLKAYQSSYELSDGELNMIYYGIMARNCISILNASHSITLQPSNTYLTISLKPAIQSLILLRQIGYNQFTQIIKQQ